MTIEEILVEVDQESAALAANILARFDDEHTQAIRARLDELRAELATHQGGPS